MRRLAAGYCFLAHWWCSLCVSLRCVSGAGEYSPSHVWDVHRVPLLCSGLGTGTLFSKGAFPGVFQMWLYWEGPSGWAGAGMGQKQDQRTENCCPRHGIGFCSWFLWRGGGLSSGPWAKGAGLVSPLWDIAPHDFGCPRRQVGDMGQHSPDVSLGNFGGCKVVEKALKTPQPGPQLSDYFHKASRALRVHGWWPSGPSAQT